ncbi:hypothetical protein ICW40_13550 [Actinotalea ferrariae]|uniref:hypothetical protein n=1 Tax=Actinotalea ferrariae TaxID=1386098 RepID=UPI001C8C9BBB|nr:hypothetical protein [Actinotalea ferrariae]MBX9245828.1 hypothetical protein [Actinotalea ferrariae]
MTLHDTDDGFEPTPVVQPTGAPPPTVLTAKRPDEQAHLLELLGDWVDWLTDRYRMDHRTIPPCWIEHGELIEELAALHLAWQAAYGHLAHGDAPLLWHEHFNLARQRLGDAVARSGCRATEHR